ncbi:MAG: hypothetical protein HOI29_01180 [Planctomycetes bacterium]|jgi:hypothetical protein|nr:hypothetical protein [Planctomycetota bacterium]
MIPVILSCWIGLLLPLPQSNQSVIPAGQIPAGVLLQGWSLATDQSVILESPILGHRSIPLLRPLNLSSSSSALILRAQLKSKGIELKPIRKGLVRGPHWATTDPDSEPPLARYQIRVVALQHLDPEPICQLLREDARKREQEIGALDRYSRFVPDPRTGSVVISCTSPRRLEQYLKLLSAADCPPVAGTHRPVLRNWATRFGRAKELALELDRAWKERGGQPIHVITHQASNSLMIRTPKHLWPAVEKLLDELDRPS